MADTNSVDESGDTSQNEEEEEAKNEQFEHFNKMYRNAQRELDNQQQYHHHQLQEQQQLQDHHHPGSYHQDEQQLECNKEWLENEQEQDDSQYLDWMYSNDVPQCLKEVLCCADSTNVGERQISCRMLLDTLRSLSDNCCNVERLFQVIDKLSQDPEINVIAELIDHVLQLARHCYNVDHLHYLIADRLVPLVLKFLMATDPQLRRSTQECLRALRVQNLIDQDVIKRDICPFIINLTYLPQATPDYYHTAITLMTKMATILGCEATEEFFIPRIIALASDPMMLVRKICVSNFGEYCTAVSTHVTENILLPSFIKLCCDRKWEVRKACAEVIMSVSCACRLETRKSTLAPICEALLSDANRSVRMAAFETLGPFITTFAEPSITGLAYNQHGQLVLTNWSGFEFRTTYKDDDRCRKYDAIHSEMEDNDCGSMMAGITNVWSRDSDSFTYPLPSVSGNLNNNDDVAQDSDDTNSNYNNRTNENLLYDNNYNNDDNANRTANINEDSDDNLQQFNTFLYWRDPLPVLDDSDSLIPLLLTRSPSSTSLTSSSFDKQEDGDDNIYTSNNCGDNNNSDNRSNEIQSKDENEESVCNSQVTVSTIDDAKSAIKSFNQQPSLLRKRAASTPLSKDSKDETSQLVEMLVMQMNNHCLSNDLNSDLSYKSQPVPSHTFSSDTSNVRQDASITAIPSRLSIRDMRDIRQLKRQSMGHQESREYYPKKLRQNIVPQELIDHFVALSDPVQGNCDDDKFVVYQIAYSLPAVAQTLGKENWPMLKNVYEKLATDKTWKVRRAVASSIHELAAIVGEDAATQDLVPIFNDIIKDLDEVRIGALKHLATFLKTLRPAGRNSFLPKLADFLMIDCNMNWRFREELAEQLLQLVGLFSAGDTYTHLMPLAILLLLDKVAAVRQVALTLVTELIHWIASDVRLLNSILVELAEQFAHCTRWNRRQTFALLCSQLVSQNALPEEIFAINVLPHLLDLAWDGVPNVRLAVARTLSTDIAPNQYFSDPQSPHHDLVMQTLRRLQADKDRDVQYLAYSKYRDVSPQPLSDESSAEQST